MNLKKDIITKPIQQHSVSQIRKWPFFHSATQDLESKWNDRMAMEF